MKTSLLITVIVLAVASAAGAREDVNPLPPGFTEVASPAAPGASAPFLHRSDGGRVTLSWVEPDGNGHRLRFATWRDNAWSEPATVARGDDWFVNWADVPSVIADDHGRMAAHWLQKTGGDTYAYGVRVSQSFDDGKTWSDPISPHRDGTPTEHGFATLILHGGYLHLVWLDGRKYGDEEQPDEMTLRAARIDRAGNLSGEVELDGRTCDCCPTAVAAIEGGFIVAYRDRSDQEIRDISIARYVNGNWESPRTLHPDNWQINGCPVNGPAMVSDGTNVAVAWFTMDRGDGVVRAARSSDRGATFEWITNIDRGEPLGRVAMTPFVHSSDVCWIGRDGDETAIELTTFPGGAGQPLVVSAVDPARSSGYPRVTVAPVTTAPDRERVILAWTVGGSPGGLRTVFMERAARVAR